MVQYSGVTTTNLNQNQKERIEIMSGIKEIDTVLIPQGSEYRMYHGLEQESEGDLITPRDAKESGVFFPIIKADVSATVKGETIPLDNHKHLMADTADGLVPLHMATKKYQIIENEKIAKAVSSALKQSDSGAVLSSMGTLNGLKTFFMSFKLDDLVIANEKNSGYLNVVGGHNGKANRFFASNLRLECMNSIHAALAGSKGYIDLRVTHSGNVDIKCADLTKDITGLIEQRKHFAEAMEILATQKVVEQDIAAIAAGYFIKDAGKVDKFSTRTMNAVSGITDLAVRGRGNSGETMYDVLNGATEYWTSGDGVGRDTSSSAKAYSSEYGTAAKHKVNFADYLLTSRDESSIEEGHRVLTATLNG